MGVLMGGSIYRHQSLGDVALVHSRKVGNQVVCTVVVVEWVSGCGFIHYEKVAQVPSSELPQSLYVCRVVVME